MATQISNHGGINYASFNTKQAIEDFLKVEYGDGLRNEFSTMDALLNRLKTEQITHKYRTKSFALGITDNIRALGKSNDMYQLSVSDYSKGTSEVVEAQFDTTKFLATFSITDEALLKGTTDGSIFDVLQDSLDRMQIGLKHTWNRYAYGSKTGKIGVIATGVPMVAGTGYKDVTVSMTNSMSLLPGMGVQLRWTATGNHRAQGYIWQKDNSVMGAEKVIIRLTEFSAGAPDSIADGTEVFSRQLDVTSATIAQEYTGLEDIIMTKDNNIFNVDRSVYKAFNATIEDLADGLLTESKLRDMSDHLAVTSPEASNINLVASNHKIISTIEKQMYQFKEYSLDTTGNGFTLGRPDIKFDNFTLFKDKYSRDKNVYMLDTNMIGELLRKDFDWLTSGREGVLERIPGTEIYEAIMTKYADMYIDGWKSQAAFKNAKETVTA